jgi:thioredoxin 1
MSSKMSADKELEKIKEEMFREMMNPAPKPSFWKDGEIAELNDTNFSKALAEADKPVLVDFWAEWCSPCKMMAPVVQQMAKDYAGRAYLAKLNVDHNAFTATKYGVMSIPNFIVFKGGRPVGQTVGAVGRQGLNALLMRGL